MPTLLLAEITNHALNESTAKALTAAQALGEPVDILVATSEGRQAAASAALLSGVRKVLLVEDSLYAHDLAEPLSALIVKLAPEYSALVASATTNGKNVMPRVAALLDVQQISEITKVIAADCFERPIYAGNALQTVQTAEAIKVITVRASAFPATATGAQAAPIEIIAKADDPQISQFENEQLSHSDRPELAAAKIIISGGRAMANAENFKTYIEPIADLLGAAMGASRAAVDAGYAPNDWQVGQTGKVVAPDLYIAVGISGAIQHLAGMKDSKIIVAINKDEDAPIFQIADYGLVADLFTALPELRQELEKLT